MVYVKLYKLEFLPVVVQILSSVYTSWAITVVGLVGQEVNLPCNITADLPNDKPALVLWYKDKSPTPIYTLDARIGPLLQARHSSNDNLVTRAYLTTVNRPATLMLNQVKKEDEGSYRCRVDFNRARTRYTDSILKVIAPPTKLVIKDNNGRILKSLIGPYDEGESLFLKCEVEGGSPMPAVTWWRESVVLDNNYSLEDEGLTVNELKISSLSRHDLMAAFTCCASNNKVSSPLSSTVTLDMNFRPLLLEMEGGRQPLSAGTPTKLNCHSAGSRPPVTITWWKEHLELKTARTTVTNHGNSTISTLIFTPTVEDDNKILSCVAKNVLMPGTILREDRKLKVHYAPLVSLRYSGKSKKSQSITEDTDVYFECLVQSNPRPTGISWMFEGGELHPNSSAGILINNHTLTLKDISRSRRGRYSCTATNSEGKGESGIFFLRVQYPPICISTHIKSFGVAVHEPLHVVCQVDAEPPDVSFRWSFNNTYETLDIVDFESHLTRSRATFTPRNEQDYGTLLCWASNEIGSQKFPCVFNITPVGPPDKPRDCRVQNVTMNSIQIACEEGYHGGLKQHFVLEVLDKNLETIEANLTSDVPVFLLSDLSYKASFEVIVYAVNSEGKSENWIMTINTLSNLVGNDENQWNFPFGPLFVIIGTSFVALIAVLLVIIIVIHIRLRTHSSRKARNRHREITRGSDERLSLKNVTGEIKTMSPLEEERCPDVIPVNEIALDCVDKGSDESVFLITHSSSKSNMSKIPDESSESEGRYTCSNTDCSTSKRVSPPNSENKLYTMRSRVMPGSSTTVLRRVVTQKDDTVVSRGETTKV
ncbi:protein turtle-like isoform X1 [Limulus polyphemus]|uniref:Protein turtle-like isoform X1 n=1 Tax=Limulus polyphemus TaxID=6850 RepID=A0ABM1S3H0_LIMPO|nr:protein turtle-like isoform X1 [Limulus polyphemus]